MRVSALVVEVFRLFLDRAPESATIAHWEEAIDADQGALRGLLAGVADSAEFRGRWGDFAAEHTQGSYQTFLNEVSQFGETSLLVRDLVRSASRHQVVVDVGARGRARSNSYDLLRHFGWSGLLIEANPALMEQIRSEFAALDIRIVNAAVSDYTGTAMLTLGINDDVASLNEQCSAQWGPVVGQVSVPVRRLQDILSENGMPLDFDLLSLDIEGEDLKVINDLMLHSDYRPMRIIIEASNDFATRSLQDLPLAKIVSETYEIYGQTRANLLLRRC